MPGVQVCVYLNIIWKTAKEALPLKLLFDLFLYVRLICCLFLVKQQCWNYWKLINTCGEFYQLWESKSLICLENPQNIQQLCFFDI